MKHTDSYNRPKGDREMRIGKLLSKLDYGSSFDKAAGWLETAGNQLSQNKPERRIQMVKQFFAAKKIRIAYAFLALAFIAAACNYPVTSNENAGDVLVWTVEPAATDAITQINALPWLREGNTKVAASTDGATGEKMFRFVIPAEKHAMAQQYKSQLEGIKGVKQVKLVELSQIVKRPVYSALLNSLFRIDINATGMSDAELKTEIENQLATAGITGATVTIVRNGDDRRVKMEFDESSAQTEGGFDMTITDGNKVERIKQMRKGAEPGKFDGKTDEEIRRMVREDFPDGDLRDEEIQIIREGDKVKVKVEKEREN